MSQVTQYGFNTSNKLRKFAISTECKQCGSQMAVSKRDPETYTCKKHPAEKRSKTAVDNERKFFEYLKAIMVNSGSKGIMIHEITRQDGKPARGELKAFLSVDLISNPSMSWPIAMMIEQSLYAIGKKSEEFLEILEAKDGLYGITWRLAPNVAEKVDKSADMISLAIDAVDRLNKGCLISGVYAESVLDEETIFYIDACELSKDEETSEDIKKKLQALAIDKKKKLPRI